MAKDERGVDHELTDSTAFVVVHIRAAYPDRADAHLDLAWTWRRHWAVFDGDVAYTAKDAGSHLFSAHHFSCPCRWNSSAGASSVIEVREAAATGLIRTG
jgi:hypothetical protein